jgi:hypothetical protein
MKNRTAMSLVELLVIMSAATVVLTLTGVLMQRAMHEQMLSRARVDAQNTSLRFADQLRRDVRDAREILLDQSQTQSGDFLKVMIAEGRTVSYSRKSGSVLRRETGGTLPQRHEEYMFSPGSELKINRLESPPRLSLTIQLRPNPSPVSREQSIGANPIPISLRVEPVIGHNARFPAVAVSTEVKP